MKLRPALSIIIPVLNEEKSLPIILNDVKTCAQLVPFSIECIVVDGGSSDSSVEQCKAFDVPVLHAPCGRGQQLRSGAEKSNGEVLLFLHADSRLTTEHCLTAVNTIQNNNVAAGGFQLKFEDAHPLMKFVEWLNTMRLNCTGVLYGDHGLFIRRDKYAACGGFKPLAIFEDIEFSQRLKKLGSVVITAPPIITSSRRFRAGGIIRTLIKMIFLYLLYWLKVPTDRIAKLYKKKSRLL